MRRRSALRWETDNDPIVLLELIQRLKVRDVMTSIVTLPRDATMQQAQELMRQKISSVPVEEKGRFFGLVSIDDIIRALVAGTIHEPCGRHMTTSWWCWRMTCRSPLLCVI